MLKVDRLLNFNAVYLLSWNCFGEIFYWLWCNRVILSSINQIRAKLIQNLLIIAPVIILSIFCLYICYHFTTLTLSSSVVRVFCPKYFPFHRILATTFLDLIDTIPISTLLWDDNNYTLFEGAQKYCFLPLIYERVLKQDGSGVAPWA